MRLRLGGGLLARLARALACGFAHFARALAYGLARLARALTVRPCVPCARPYVRLCVPCVRPYARPWTLRVALRFGAAAFAVAFFFLRLTAIGCGVILSLVGNRPGVLPNLYSITSANASFDRRRRAHRRVRGWKRTSRAVVLDPRISVRARDLGCAKRSARRSRARRSSRLARGRNVQRSRGPVSHGKVGRRRRSTARRARNRARGAGRSLDGRVRRARVCAHVYGARLASRARCEPAGRGYAGTGGGAARASRSDEASRRDRAGRRGVSAAVFRRNARRIAARSSSAPTTSRGKPIRRARRPRCAEWRCALLRTTSPRISSFRCS